MTRRRDPQTGQLMREGIHPVVSERTGAVTYRVRRTYTDGEGVRRYISRNFKTCDDATDYLLATDIGIARGTYRHADDAKITTAEYWRSWMSRMERRWEASTVYHAQKAWANVFAPLVGSMPVSMISRATCQHLVDDMARRGHKASSIRTRMATFRGMLKAAVRDGHLSSNPATDLIYPVDPATPMVTFSPDDARTFLRVIAKRQFGPLWTFMLLTGARFGEAAALHWEDVDTQRGTAHLRRTTTITTAGKTVIRDGTKSGPGRIVPVPELALDRMRTARKSGPLVFAPRGNVLLNHSVTESLDRVTRKHALPRITLHGLRHSAATLMYEAGISDRVIQELLGHTSLQTTLHYYVHVNLDAQRDGVTRLATLLGDATTSAPESHET